MSLKKFHKDRFYSYLISVNLSSREGIECLERQTRTGKQMDPMFFRRVLKSPTNSVSVKCQQISPNNVLTPSEAGTVWKPRESGSKRLQDAN